MNRRHFLPAAAIAALGVALAPGGLGAAAARSGPAIVLRALRAVPELSLEEGEHILLNVELPETAVEITCGKSEPTLATGPQLRKLGAALKSGALLVVTTDLAAIERHVDRMIVSIRRHDAAVGATV